MRKLFSLSPEPHYKTRQSSRHHPKCSIKKKKRKDSILLNTALLIDSTEMTAYKHKFEASVAVPFVCSNCSTANIELLFLTYFNPIEHGSF